MIYVEPFCIGIAKNNYELKSITDETIYFVPN